MDDRETDLQVVLMEKSMKFHFRFSELGISESDIIDECSESNEPLPDLFLGYIDEIVRLAEDGCRVKGFISLYHKAQLNWQNSKLIIGDETFTIGKIITGQIKESSKIAVFVCTAGSFLEDYAKQQMRDGNFPEAYIADKLGSLVVETAMDKIQEQLRIDLLNEGLKITNRFSTGYCGWNVSEQHKLFKLIPKGVCGIYLTDSALMQPIKSVSGIIGIGSRVNFRQHACNICNMQECIYRGKKKRA